MMAKPMAMPGRVIKVARVLLTALAAMAAVPKPETRESKRILPSWNMLFSSPLGTPIYKMRLMSVASNFKENGRFRWTSCLGFSKSTIITTAATMRETNVGMAAPATPICKP